MSGVRASHRPVFPKGKLSADVRCRCGLLPGFPCHEHESHRGNEESKDCEEDQQCHRTVQLPGDEGFLNAEGDEEANTPERITEAPSWGRRDVIGAECNLERN